MRIALTPGVRVFVDIEGPEWVPEGPTLRQKPTLVLLHGGPGFDHSSFKPLFSELSDLVQVVYYDHRGQGRSDPRPRDEWTLDTLADDVVRLCDALGIEHPMVLGQSFGGFVAQRYIARHPSHPAKVILSSTSPHMGLARKLAMFERLGGEAARAAAERFWTAPSRETFAPYQQRCMPLYRTVPPADEEAAQRTLFNEEVLFTWAATEMPGMDLLPGLERAQCPVLVLAGEMDPVCPAEDARDIAAALPPRWCRHVELSHCGHGVWRDDPERGMAVLRAFLAEGPGEPAAR